MFMFMTNIQLRMHVSDEVCAFSFYCHYIYFKFSSFMFKTANWYILTLLKIKSHKHLAHIVVKFKQVKGIICYIKRRSINTIFVASANITIAMASCWYTYQWNGDKKKKTVTSSLQSGFSSDYWWQVLPMTAPDLVNPT